MYYPVVAFDLDGTLLRRTTITLLLAEHFDHVHAIEELERAFAAGEISNRVIADVSATFYDRRRTSEIMPVFAGADWIDGLAETVRRLKEAGTQVLIATITWRLAAEFLRERYGLAGASGTELQINGGVVEGKVIRYFDEHDKLRFVEAWCSERGIPLADVAAVGDSRSDLPLFGQVGRAVAINATPDARQAASVAIDTEDLRAVLPLLER